ncbi:MAG: sigma-70 family RNA polymerase sigma factor [Planctomycetota bacterium]|nr:sigma-70 family RNA polymerase sigma factor [Planctomycetota bacterium]
MAIPADDALLGDLAAGREEAFAQLYDLWGERLLRAARDICGSHEDAEDAVQDVFTGLVRAGPALAGVRNLKAYLFSALHRATLRRAEKRRIEHPMDSAGIEPATKTTPPAAEAADRLHRALDALPAEQRAVVALKVDGDLTFEEVGAVLAVSANTAASRYRYALARLRAALGQGREAQQTERT